MSTIVGNRALADLRAYDAYRAQYDATWNRLFWDHEDDAHEPGCCICASFDERATDEAEEASERAYARAMAWPTIRH